MYVFLIVVTLSFSLICLIFLLYDLFHIVKSVLGRKHIGNWINKQEWEKAVLHRTNVWIKRTPVVRQTDISRLLLFDVLRKKNKNQNIQSWQSAALLLALTDKMRSEDISIIKKKISTILQPEGSWKTTPKTVDCGLLSYAVLRFSDINTVNLAVEDSVRIIEQNIGIDGMIAYSSQPNADERFVDTLGFVCPFLVVYSKKYSKPHYADLAIRQLKIFSEHAIEPSSLLPNHAYSAKTKLPLGVYGWGRGVGWYVIGLLDSYLEYPYRESPDRLWLLNQIEKIAISYSVFQKKDGSFGHIFQMESGYDSSATAVMAYFYAQCGRLFQSKKYLEISTLCLSKLMSVTRRNGAIDYCQGDTKEIGIFSQSFDLMPFAQGFATRAILSLRNTHSEDKKEFRGK